VAPRPGGDAAVSGNDAVSVDEAAGYWEQRARRYAREGPGLRAVCSYGMPGFYNGAIHLSQRLALGPWLRVNPGTAVLDLGCGVGRWSRMLARRGAVVTGVDLSATMVDEARRRADAEGLGSRCLFQQQDLAALELKRTFDLVVGVTVLQHILDPGRLRVAVERIARHLKPGGRCVLIESAPSRASDRCDSATFRARAQGEYESLFAAAGLRMTAVTGVDPAPFKIWILPHYNRLPGPIAVSLLAAVTAVSLPIDALLGRRWVGASWHKLFVLERAQR
jgi:2-polyprenyl-3-methyl-5-hydroxy-6-metoxy-1,4-benzoquinol methylase